MNGLENLLREMGLTIWDRSRFPAQLQRLKRTACWVNGLHSDVEAIPGIELHWCRTIHGVSGLAGPHGCGRRALVRV